MHIRIRQSSHEWVRAHGLSGTYSSGKLAISAGEFINLQSKISTINEIKILPIARIHKKCSAKPTVMDTMLLS